MNFPSKVAAVILCALTCAAAIVLTPVLERKPEPQNPTTPVLLRKSQDARWLLV